MGQGKLDQKRLLKRSLQKKKKKKTTVCNRGSGCRNHCFDLTQPTLVFQPHLLTLGVPALSVTSAVGRTLLLPLSLEHQCSRLLVTQCPQLQWPSTSNYSVYIISIKTCSTAKSSNCRCLLLAKHPFFSSYSPLEITKIVFLFLSTSDHLITKPKGFSSGLHLFVLSYLKLLTISMLVNISLLWFPDMNTLSILCLPFQQICLLFGILLLYFTI